MAGVYSFLDCQCAMTGPGGTFSLSEGGVAEEGITVAMRDAKNTMVIGADGTPMHSLHAGKGGTVTLRLQKTSPINELLMDLYNFQTTSSAFHARNVFTIANPVTGDAITAQACAFQKLPDNVNSTEAGTMEWVFDAGVIDQILGSGAVY